VTTEKQAAANRENAKLSTGPNTDKGRERSKMNALKHGLTAEAVVISDEDAEEFESFRDAMFEDCAPVGVLQHALVERLVFCAWRLRRPVRREADLDRGHFDARFGGVDLLGTGDSRGLWSVNMNLLRYETAIERSLYRAIHDLERMQARRKEQKVAAPTPVRHRARPVSRSVVTPPSNGDARPGPH
jgi:hypothetical protein